MHVSSADDALPAMPAKRPAGQMETEISRLYKELASVELDIEILRKATAYFAKGSRCSTHGSMLAATSTVSAGFAGCLTFRAATIASHVFGHHA